MCTIIITASLGLGVMGLLGKFVHIIWHIRKPAANAQGYVPIDIDRRDIDRRGQYNRKYQDDGWWNGEYTRLPRHSELIETLREMECAKHPHGK
jgi:hypothetical protein